MIEHFGVRLPQREGGHRLTRDNYICTTRDGRYYFEDGWLKAEPQRWEGHRKDAMRNFDASTAYFASLPLAGFRSAVEAMAARFPELERVGDLGEWAGVAGAYVLVLEERRQLYVGQARAAGGIRQRILVHWQKKPAFDRLLSGSPETSIMSIDSFRALDTTAIYACACAQPGPLEQRILESLPERFCANRTRGGDLAGGLAEAIAERRSRDLSPFIAAPR